MKRRIIVVGGGLAGLMSAIKIAERGVAVDLFSLVPVKRSHSVCAQGGINAAKNQKGEGDSPEIHFDDTIYGGDFLANQPLVRDMCYAAPEIIDLLDRMGVPFTRTPEGNLDYRRFGGTLFNRTVFSGATTGQQMLYAMDEQVRRFEAEGLVEKYEGWEFLGFVKDNNGMVRGITAIHMPDMRVQAFRGDAVLMCHGGPGMIFGKSTNSYINTGAAAGRCYREGCIYANGEFIQVHPTAIPGQDKLRLMSESARGEGGRIWTYKNGKPWYFLEEKYPKYGNLVPRDIAAREIFDVCVNQGLGLDGKNEVYLDVTHLPETSLRKLEGILEIYEKFVGDDPRKVPMRIYPGVHYSMGGLWIDDQHRSNLPGVYVVGEADYQYHGANRLGANSLLSCVWGGMVAGPHAVQHVEGLVGGAEAQDESIYEEATRLQNDILDGIYRQSGPDNPYRLQDELGDLMTRNVTTIRHNDKLRETDLKLMELRERVDRVGVTDGLRVQNQYVLVTRQLGEMIDLARVITLGALRRDESRGAHYKPEFPDRDDENFLKTTMAKFTPEGPEFSWEEVDASLIEPRERVYTK